MLFAALVILYTAPTSKAELGNTKHHQGHLKVCSAHQSPRAELRCGKVVLHKHHCAVRWIKNHSIVLVNTTALRSRYKFHRWMERRARHWIREAKSRFIPTSVRGLICYIFKSACPMALLVAKRESGYSIHAHNGQYLGIFQMGSSERAKFATIGYSTAYEQIVAAHNYYLVSGWSPWSETAY